MVRTLGGFGWDRLKEELFIVGIGGVARIITVCVCVCVCACACACARARVCVCVCVTIYAVIFPIALN